MNTVLAPSPVSAPWVWSADELTSREGWIIRVSDDAVREIDGALAAVKQRGLPLKKITAGDFPLPSLARDLRRVKDLLADGPGIALIRGLPVDRYPRDDIDLMLWGLGAHVGQAVAQSYRGDVIGEVM